MTVIENIIITNRMRVCSLDLVLKFVSYVDVCVYVELRAKMSDSVSASVKHGLFNTTSKTSMYVQ